MDSTDVPGDIQALRTRARRQVAAAVAPAYGADSKTVFRLLKDVVAAEVLNVAGPSHPELLAAESLLGMVKQDLAAEQIAIERYLYMFKDPGGWNSTAWRMLQEILPVRAQHAGALGNLVEDLRSRLRNKLRAKLN